MKTSLLKWVAGRDTGISSMAIFSHMATGFAEDAGHPHDPDDFGRCYRLLLLTPEWKSRLGEMGRYSAEWRALADRWPELERMYEAATPPTEGARWKMWEPMYNAMRDLLNKARVCGDCGKVGMNSWTTYPDTTKRCWECGEKHGKAGRTTIELGRATLEHRP